MLFVGGGGTAALGFVLGVVQSSVPESNFRHPVTPSVAVPHDVCPLVQSARESRRVVCVPFAVMKLAERSQGKEVSREVAVVVPQDARTALLAAVNTRNFTGRRHKPAPPCGRDHVSCAIQPRHRREHAGDGCSHPLLAARASSRSTSIRSANWAHTCLAGASPSVQRAFSSVEVCEWLGRSTLGTGFHSNTRTTAPPPATRLAGSRGLGPRRFGCVDGYSSGVCGVAVPRERRVR